MKVAGLSFVALFVLVLGAIAFDGRNDDSPAATPTPAAGANQLVVEQGGKRVTVSVEIAATADQRQVGLMNRQSMPEDAGMLFLFKTTIQYGFWMKNTYIPLDIAYIGADGTVQQIFAAKPLDETVLIPDAPYRYVLEVNQGWFERHGMGVGAKVTLPPNLPPVE
ncbi:MAG: DUF192 domain-containing protein [Dehalococcoidia bacterium]|nr:DUF192 domain-containing protein [Dehalococcoidia bacterium]